MLEGGELMVIELNQIAPWAAVILSAVALYMSIRNRRDDKETEKVGVVELQIGTVAGKLDLLQDRVIRVESELDHMPDKDVTHRLEVALKSVEAEMGRLSERMKPIAAMADRIQEVMVDRGFNQ